MITLIIHPSAFATILRALTIARDADNFDAAIDEHPKRFKDVRRHLRAIERRQKRAAVAVENEVHVSVRERVWADFKRMNGEKP